MDLGLFFRLIPEELKAACCIAGGAAVDLGKANDVDVFILTKMRSMYSVEDYKYCFDQMQHKDIVYETDKPQLPRAATGRTIMTINTFNQPLCMQSTSKYAKGLGLFATINTGLIPVQIILTEYGSVEHMLANFDISTHAVAYTPDGERHTVPFTTDTNTPPTLGYVHDPNKTLERYRKIVLRYGMCVDIDAVLELMTMPEPVRS